MDIVFSCLYLIQTINIQVCNDFDNLSVCQLGFFNLEMAKLWERKGKQIRTNCLLDLLMPSLNNVKTFHFVHRCVFLCIPNF
jgi:hypothetical protein